RLLSKLNEHFERVVDIYERVIHAQKPLYYSGAPPVEESPVAREEETEVVETHHPAPSNIIRFLDEKAPALAARIGRARLSRGLRPFEHFLEKIGTDGEWLDLLDGDAVLTGYTL